MWLRTACRLRATKCMLVRPPGLAYRVHSCDSTALVSLDPQRCRDPPDGAVSADGRIAGCYVHGLFGVTAARAALLSAIGAAPSQDDHAARVDAALDEIAGELERCLDIGALAAIAGI